MEFKKYNKIHALHKPECHEMLHGEVHIQEKIDGANASIWMSEDGTVHCGSRNNDLTQKVLDGKEISKEFVRLLEYVKNHKGINDYLNVFPEHRICGEWLVPHTIGYNESSYNEFYLFDVEFKDESFMGLEEVNAIGKRYGIKTPHYHGLFKGLQYDEIKEMAGTSVLGEKGEGLVIKPVNFVNQFDDRPYAKYVTEKFKEDNGVTFGGNNKYSDTYYEMRFVNRFITLARVEKIVRKLRSTFVEGEYLDYKHIPHIMSTVLYDAIQEEGYTIATEMGKSGDLFSFKSFNRIASKKAKSIFLEILTGKISVANTK